MKGKVGSGQAGLPVEDNEFSTKQSPGLVQLTPTVQVMTYQGKKQIATSNTGIFSFTCYMSCLSWLVQVTEASRQLSPLHRVCCVSTINILLYNRNFSNQNYRNQPSEQKSSFHKRVVQAGLFWPP